MLIVIENNNLFKNQPHCYFERGACGHELFFNYFFVISGRSSSVPPPRTDSSRCRVRQYTDKLLSIQGAKYRNHPERSPTKSTTGFEPPNLAPIPEERYSFIEQQDAVSELKARNENLRSEFFKDLIPNNEIGSNSDYGSLKRKKQLISASLNSLLEKDRQTAASTTMPVNAQSQTLSRSSADKQTAVATSHHIVNINMLSQTPSRSSIEKDSKHTAVSKAASPCLAQQLTQQLTPVNPLSRTPSRSRSNSPMTFTSCVKVQYRPKMSPNQPLYGFNQFQDRTFQNASNINQVNDLSRSRSAAAIISHNYSNTQSGIYHATPFDNNTDLSNDVSVGEQQQQEKNTSPPPRPPLPKNYETPYFLSLPRDWQELTRSSSYSAMLC